MTRKCQSAKKRCVQDDQQSPLLQLIKRRVELGVTQGQAADFLKLPIEYIKAMEAGQFERLPGRTFARGYLRAYANYLNLPVELVMEAITNDGDERVARAKPHLRIRNQLKPGDPIVRIASYSITALFLVLSIGWWTSQRSVAASSANSAVADVVLMDGADTKVSVKNAGQE